MSVHALHASTTRLAPQQQHDDVANATHAYQSSGQVSHQTSHTREEPSRSPSRASLHAILGRPTPVRFVETYRHDAEPRSNNEADQGACAANAPGDATGIRAGDAASKIAPARNSSSHNAPNAQPPQRSDGFPTTPVAPMNEPAAATPDANQSSTLSASNDKPQHPSSSSQHSPSPRQPPGHPDLSRAQSPGTVNQQPANGAKANSRRQQAPQPDLSNGIPEHLIRDVSYVPKRRGRPPAAPSNGYERVLSPVGSGYATMSAADQNMEGMRMALDAVARESARAGALQAQLDRALQDVHHLRQKEQAMLGEFDHRVARAIKHHKQQLEGVLAAQQSRIEELEERLRGVDGAPIKDPDSSTIVPDTDSQRTTSLSPPDGTKARLPVMPVQTSSPEPKSASLPPSDSSSSSRSSARLGRFETGQGRSTSGSGTKLEHVKSEKRPAADHETASAGSARSAKRRRTSPDSDGFFDVARMRAYATAGAPIPEYDIQRIKLIYEEDAKGNNVCRVCSLHTPRGQSVGFPVGTPEVDLVMHGVGAHPGLWHSPMASETLLNSQAARA